MTGSKRLLWGLVFLFQSVPLAAQAPAERDWSAALRDDAQALHDDIAANHPGPLNREDPGFAERNHRQLQLALERARDARTYADYFFPLREYVASFDDGHMSFGALGDTPNDLQWPGFLTEYDGREMKVVVTGEDAPVPTGAKLLGCDGMTAEEYAAATLGKMWGRWHLRSQRLGFGRFLFVDEGNRYIPRARSCRFEVNGEQRLVAMNWQPTAIAEFLKRLEAITPRRSRSFEVRTLSNGMQWYSIPSFDADPRSQAGKALPPMIAAMRGGRAVPAAAAAIVLDLRGNGGGSSDWSRQIAEILWGRAALEQMKLPPIHVDWRVSPANLEALRQRYAQQKAGEVLSPDMKNWFETAIAGMGAALARGEGLWRHSGGKGKPATSRPVRLQAPPPPLGGTVYLLTDAHCMSACLDAIDLWRALGAVHVGQTTSADTLYMELRHRTLPSGIGAVSVPMKVYRGRPRGSNEPAVPVHSFEGDITDTAAIERWIATLGSSRRPSP